MAKRNSLARDRQLADSVQERDAVAPPTRPDHPTRRRSGRAKVVASSSSGLSIAPKSGATPLASVNGDAADATPASLDRLIHERIRLGIVSALAVNAHLSFNELKALMGTTDGNLSVHARKLEEAGYVSCTKSFQGRVPKTDYALTPVGRRALEQYLAHMEAIIKATRER